MVKAGFLMFCGFSFGLLSAAGVFTVFSTVGLVPRFAGKTHSAKEIFLYENMIVAGTIIGCLVSIWPETWGRAIIRLEEWSVSTGMVVSAAATVTAGLWEGISFWTISQLLWLIVIGLFSGMFVGCFALSIAEMLDSIPIFTRRISFRKGIGLAICSVAAGKLCGSLYFFVEELYRAVQK